MFKFGEYYLGESRENIYHCSSRSKEKYNRNIIILIVIKNLKEKVQ